MTAARQARFWLIGLAVFLAVVWLLSGILSPFVAGLAIAYMLDPLVDWLSRHSVRRWLGTSVVLIAFGLLFFIVAILVVPLIIGQIGQFVAALPGYVERIGAFISRALEDLRMRFGTEQIAEVQALASQYLGNTLSWIGSVVPTVLRGGLAIIDVVSFLIITPVVAFYLLRDWDRLITTVDSYVPLRQQAMVRALANDVNRTLASFIRGQLTVCLVLGTFYAVALTIAGLNFGLLVGFSAGLISFVPYVGSIVGFLASIGIAAAQFDGWTMPLVIAGIFFAGQAIEGNVLTPKLVGDSVGLHPVWVMFALLAGGSLLGFTGVLMAVPVASVIGVLARFALSKYRLSILFHGVNDSDQATAEPDSKPFAEE